VTERRAWIGIAIVVALSVVRVAMTHRVFAQTSDEHLHLIAGYDVLTRHSWRTDLHHPPLARVFFALPFLDTPPPPGDDRSWRGNELLFGDGQYTRNLARARMGNLLFLALGIVFVARWAMRILSPAAGLTAGALFAMLPPVLAHGGLATTDMVVTAMMAFALDESSRLLESPTWRRGVMCGLAVGLGVLSKYSFLVFFPAAAMGVLLGLLMKRRADGGVRPSIVALLIAAGVTVVIVFAGFGFSFRPLIDGILDVRRHNVGGHRNFLFGELRWPGWWYYFPIAIFFKTPIPFLILMLAGCALLLRRRPEVPLSALAILGVAMASNINIGIRHILPMYPALAIAAAAPIVLMPRLRIAHALLVAWLFADGVAAHPDYLAWFNGFARHPEQILNDSNLDWGQDVLRLARYARRERLPFLSLLVFTSADVERLGFPPHKVITSVDEPVHGWFAVSEMEIAIGETHSERVQHWLDGLIAGKPYKRIGKSIRLYDLP